MRVDETLVDVVNRIHREGLTYSYGKMVSNEVIRRFIKAQYFLTELDQDEETMQDVICLTFLVEELIKRGIVKDEKSVELNKDKDNE